MPTGGYLCELRCMSTEAIHRPSSSCYATAGYLKSGDSKKGLSVSWHPHFVDIVTGQLLDISGSGLLPDVPDVHLRMSV